MSALVMQILALLAAAPGAVAQVEALWQTVKQGASAKDVATINGVLAFLNPKVDTDIAALHAAALAAS
jgi:hypothetical protein